MRKNILIQAMGSFKSFWYRKFFITRIPCWVLQSVQEFDCVAFVVSLPLSIWELLFIFWALATLGIVMRHLAFLLKSFTYFGISLEGYVNWSRFALFIVLGDCCQRKKELTRINFCAIIYYNFQRGFSR